MRPYVNGLEGRGNMLARDPPLLSNELKTFKVCLGKLSNLIPLRGREKVPKQVTEDSQLTCGRDYILNSDIITRYFLSN